jgi:hypothetical protein
MGHALNWTPGNHGKGLVTPEGDVHIWNVNRQDGRPVHQEYIEQAFGVPESNPYSEYNAFEIGPEGKVYEGPSDIDQLDPRLVPTKKWRFQSAHQLGWQPGQWGKGLVHGGNVHAWNTGVYDGQPTHPQYAEETLGVPHEQWLFGKMWNSAFQIHPDGKVRFWEPVDNDMRDLVQSAHPHFDTYASPYDSAWNFQARVAMPVKEDYWRMYPGALYHGTTEDRLPSIMQHGLHPWDSDVVGGSNYEDDMDWLRPRPEHVYLSPSAERAHDRAKNLGFEGKPVVIKVDPSYLKPENINPDEDEMYRHNVPNAPSPWTNSRDAPKELGDSASLGEWAEQHGWGENPLDTQKVLDAQGSVAHRGIVPPQALTPGTYDVDMNDPPPRDFQWRPIEWPRTASLIDDMRDSCGRFAAAAPWEYGKSGKGIYFPETGALQTWGDDRTHPDVWLDDENASQPGGAHHLVIRPNGTVYDQGCFDRNYEDVVGDREGLQRSLQEFDPRLKVDKSNSWTFDMRGPGPTEPMEEEPSMSRGEQGDMNHGVQTSGDYAGSL